MKLKFFIYLFITVLLFASCKGKQKVVGTEPAGKYTGKKGLTENEKIEFTRLYFDAEKQKILTNYDIAEELFNKCIAIDPRNGAPYYEIASINAFRGDHKVAIEHARTAVNAEPQNLWYSTLLAESLVKEKQLEEAISVYQKMLKYYPDRIDLYYALATVQTYAGKNDDAISTYEKLESKIGISQDISLEKLRIYKGVLNFDKTLKELKRLIIAFPQESKYYGMLGELYQQKGMKEKALETYTELLKIDPDNAYVHLSLADYYRSIRENEKSFNELKLAFANPGLDIDSKISILVSYYAVTETYSELKDEAFELCNILVRVHPQEAKSFAMLGDFLYRDKKLEKARDAYRRSIELDKQKFALWQQLLIIESEMEDFNSMEKESKEAIELFPSQPLPYLFSGLALINQKKYTEALEALNEGKQYVFDNKPLLSQFYSNIGDAYYRLKKISESDESYDKALTLDPDNIYVLNNYAYYLSLRGEKLEQAEKMSKHTIEIQANNNSYLDTYGWILYKMGKYEEAKIWLQKAIDNGGTGNSVMLEHYGDVLFRLGEVEEANRYWLEAKKKGKGSEFLDKKIAEKKLFE
jgi:pentatricopeptide repeat protein